jgi:hypothetical protein
VSHIVGVRSTQPSNRYDGDAHALRY